MDIYHLWRTDYVGIDELAGLVVIADTQESARLLAAQNHRDEGRDMWLGGRVTVRHIGFAVDGSCEEGVVLSDIHEA